ncbi:hypothetical protein H4R19_002728 [Coemansia spiralis]|nr:hypothetical protein H4R19_002728 [Coemansia spiralis]
MGFLDVTRIYHLSTRVYTFHNSRQQRSRIDQIWVMHDLLELCHRPRIDLAIDSDHRPLSLTLDPADSHPPATTWWLNTSLLQQDSLRNVAIAALRAPADPEHLAAAWHISKNAITKEAHQLGIRLKHQSNLLLDKRLPVLEGLE